MGAKALVKAIPPLVAIILFTLYFIAIQPHLNGYVSDEIWYVSGARNFINEAGLGRYLVKYGVSVSPYPGCSISGVEPSKVYSDYDIAWYSNVTYSEVEDVLANKSCIVRFGNYYPDKSGILTYLNIEHPYLGKYFIALSMLTLGDYPEAWRVPSLILSLLMIVLVYLAALRISRGSIWYGALALIPLMFDATFRDMGIVAMLDVYLGFFTILSAYLYLEGRYMWAIIAGGLSVASKYPGAFTAFSNAYVESYRRSGAWGLATLIIAFIVFIVLQIPVIYVVGGLTAYVSNVMFYLKWFTEPRPPGPVSSNPLDWLVGLGSFVNNVSPPLYAMGMPGAYLVALALSLLILIPQTRSRLFEGFSINELILPVMVLTIWFGYWLVYFLGNTTLYSYYTMQIAPLAPLILVLGLHRARIRVKPWVFLAILAGIAYGISVQWRLIYGLVTSIA